MGIAALNHEDITVIALHSSKTGDKPGVDAAWIDRQHRDQGRIRIGYHFVICRDGAVEGGRPLTQRGVHLEDRNHCSIGICVVGGKPTKKQQTSIDSLVEGLLNDYPFAQVEDYLPT